jgi:predicted DNA-binding transcriptional regulator AlpA
MGAPPKSSSPLNAIRLLRFRDLKAAGIVDSTAQLSTLVKRYNFPKGFKLSPNVRVWKQSTIESWIETRPAADGAPLRGIVKARVEAARGRR